jgi:prephenate dehydratase
MKAAIQGIAGSFSHAAARALAGPAVEIVPCETFGDLFDAVVGGEAKIGVVPVENSLAGAVTENLDLLFEYDLHCVQEAYVRVELCVVAPPGVALADLRSAASHPVALRQCRRFFSEHPEIAPVAVYDTAGSIADLMAGQAAYHGAIGSRLAAELYEAEILRSGIEDDPRNFTRFFAVTALEGDQPLERPKTSLAFVTEHRPGALHDALGIMSRHGADLTRLESRPIPGSPWEYRFYVDFRSPDAGRLEACLDALRAATHDLRVFGSYAEAQPPLG